MADKGDSNDPLLNKLDSLMQTGHARKAHDPPPRLTDAVPQASGSAIPTLTDAVEVPPAPVPEQQGSDPVDSKQLIASRLVAVVDKEMGKLSKELAAHGPRLAALHRSLRFALPELVRLRWEETPDQNTEPEDEDDADSGQ
jgi:hypothetical protein